jgi:hypothetical protein
LSFAFFLCGLGFGLIAYIWVAFSAFVTPIIVLERTGVIAGMQRAWVLGKARVWTILGVSIAILMITFVIGLALGFAVQLVIRPAIGSASYTAATAVQIILQTIVAVFIAPIWPITLTLLHYDARVRVEGLDIALQAVDKPDPRPIELSVIFIASGAGLQLGWALLNPERYTRRDALGLAARRAVTLVLTAFPLLAIAGVIEGFLSPSSASFGVRLGVGVASGIALYTYLLLAGRQQKQT